MTLMEKYWQKVQDNSCAVHGGDVNCLTPHASRLTPHASRLTPHASRLTPHASKGMYLIRTSNTVAVMHTALQYLSARQVGLIRIKVG